MPQFKFKTSIKCGGCISTVTPFIQQIEGVKSWEVDLISPDRILSVELENNETGPLELAIRQAGYSIEKLTE